MKGGEMAGKHPSLLVIDDEPDMRDMLSFDLTAEGYEVVTVASGAAAVEAVSAREFDLAITDLRMPGMDGVETLASIKKLDPDIEVIIATAYSSVETAVECMHSGAFSYLQKPYGLDELRELVKRGLETGKRSRTVVLNRAGTDVLQGMAAGDPLRLTLESAVEVLEASSGGVVLKKGSRVATALAVTREGPEPPEKILARAAAKAADAAVAYRCPSSSCTDAQSELSDAGFSSVLARGFEVNGVVTGTVVFFRKTGEEFFHPVDEKTLAILLPQIALAAALGEAKKRNKG
jgi:CheY-like chemotaxis protein